MSGEIFKFLVTVVWSMVYLCVCVYIYIYVCVCVCVCGTT